LGVKEGTNVGKCPPTWPKVQRNPGEAPISPLRKKIWKPPTKEIGLFLPGRPNNQTSGSKILPPGTPVPAGTGRLAQLAAGDLPGPGSVLFGFGLGVTLQPR